MGNYITANKPVVDLIPYARNSRTHSDEQVNQIAASIKEFGFTNPIIIDEDNGIIAGHGRVMAAKKLGIDEVPCIQVTGWTKAQKKAYVIADNKLALNAGWDEEMLKLEFDELKELDFDISLIGFSDMELADLFPDDETEGLTDEDAVPELAEIPVSKEGDIWILGNHRVMCGDSTDAGSVAILMGGQKADMVFTDPPYGINEKGDRSKRGGATQGGNFKDFIDDSIEYAVKAFNICDELNIPRQVWWGANYYAHHIPQSNNWFVWDKRVEDKQKDTQSDCELAWVKSKWSSVRIFRHLWKGMLKDSERGQSRVHPTQKPVELAIWSFDYFKDVTSVLDLFLGSGSTLIACEKTNRKCYGMELDPHYVDVIIKRWQEFTGKEAVHEDGRKFNEVVNVPSS
jgi:DNA modification methylase